MNRYLKRGLIFVIIGIVLCYYGLYSKDPVAAFYKLPLLAGVMAFGYGFVMVIYSLMRKIERRSIEEERSTQELHVRQEKSANE